MRAGRLGCHNQKSCVAAKSAQRPNSDRSYLASFLISGVLETSAPKPDHSGVVSRKPFYVPELKFYGPQLEGPSVPLSGPLNSAHQVGIYDASSQTLLASATVTNASTGIDGYLYTSLGSPVVLPSGDYWIVGTTLGPGDGWIFQADDIVTDSAIAYLTSGFTSGNGGALGFPASAAPDRQYLEVNFMTSPVPEPGGLSLLGLGLLGLVAASRRRSAR